MSEKFGLFDWINSISHTKELKLDEYNHHQYSRYMINKAFSQHADTILYACKMNLKQDLDKYAHFGYMNNVIRKRKRYGKWAKEKNIEELEVIMEYYPNMSKDKAQSVLPLLLDKIEFMREKLYKGGKV